MPRIVDPVAVRHPGMPGEVHIVPSRQLPSLTKRGWVEAKSPAAKAAVEQERPPEGDQTPTPSKEAES